MRKLEVYISYLFVHQVWLFHSNISGIRKAILCSFANTVFDYYCWTAASKICLPFYIPWGLPRGSMFSGCSIEEEVVKKKGKQGYTFTFTSSSIADLLQKVYDLILGVGEMQVLIQENFCYECSYHWKVMTLLFWTLKQIKALKSPVSLHKAQFPLTEAILPVSRNFGKCSNLWGGLFKEENIQISAWQILAS